MNVTRKYLFYYMWWAIGLISLIDLCLALATLDPNDMIALSQTEKNPWVVQMIEYTGDLSLFAILKILGTLVVLFVCKKMYDRNTTSGLAICGGVCLFQLCLLIYLFC